MRLTALGREAQDARRSGCIARSSTHGRRPAALRAALAGVLERPDLLVLELRPHPGGWRGTKPYLAQTESMLEDPAATLPHYPMVLHRGGWPDGS